MENPEAFTWQLMSSHGLVLLYIVRNPDATILEVSRRVGLTERRVSQIINDLRLSDVFAVHRQGRRNLYEFNREARLHDWKLRSMTVGQLVDMLEMCETAS